MTDEEWLESICENCRKANGGCIIGQPYIGLCAKEDRDELLEIRKEREQR